MPGGHGGSSGGSHFGGGSFSHGGSHFSGSRSSSHGGSHFTSSRSSYPGIRPSVHHRPWYGPRVVVFGGRQVYLSSGRASTASILGVLIILSIIIMAFLGFSWMGTENDLKTIRTDYEFYRNMAETGANNSAYVVHGTVTSYEPYDLDSKYYIEYEFTAGNGETGCGHSYYVYTYEQVVEMSEHGVDLALSCKYVDSNEYTDSVPLDYRNTTLETDDAEYADYMNSRKSQSIGTFVMLGVTALLIVTAVLVRATAQKATAEQIAANNSGNAASSNSQTAPAGTWRCEYCNAVNDNSKERCDGCGAIRQK